MAQQLRTVNIEAGLPTVDEARKKLLDELNLAKRQGVTAIKVIHGYGSSGTGGTLKIAIRKSLSLRRKEGKIRSFVGGEEWNIFEERTRSLLDDCPDLSRDSDLNRHNSGITIVLL